MILLKVLLKNMEKESAMSAAFILVGKCYKGSTVSGKNVRYTVAYALRCGGLKETYIASPAFLKGCVQRGLKVDNVTIDKAGSLRSKSGSGIQSIPVTPAILAMIEAEKKGPGQKLKSSDEEKTDINKAKRAKAVTDNKGSGQKLKSSDEEKFYTAFHKIAEKWAKKFHATRVGDYKNEDSEWREFNTNDPYTIYNAHVELDNSKVVDPKYGNRNISIIMQFEIKTDGTANFVTSGEDFNDDNLRGREEYEFSGNTMYEINLRPEFSLENLKRIEAFMQEKWGKRKVWGSSNGTKAKGIPSTGIGSADSALAGAVRNGMSRESAALLASCIGWGNG